jgi:type II secretory pathway pseudopilin PulG
LIAFCTTLQAQGGITKQTIEFPKVSFTWHEDNPEQKQQDDFVLKDGNENGKTIDFDFVPQTPNITDVSRQKTILFLWEDMAEHGIGQFNFTKNTLSAFFNEAALLPADKFAVAVFNRRKNAPLSLKHLTKGFESDKSQINVAIQNYRHSTETYKEFPNRSDMYTAIREGLDLFQSTEENVKAIVVFTAGYSMKNSGSDSEPQVLLKAQGLHIPVYVIEYYNRSGLASEPEGFAKSTYGLFQYYTKANEAKKGLTGIYTNMSERYYGHDYQISFSFEGKRDSKSHLFPLMVSGISQTPISFTFPPLTPQEWIQENIALVIGIAVLVIVLIILSIVLIRKKGAAQQAEIQRIEREQQAAAEAARKEAEKNKQDLIDYQEGEEQKKREAKFKEREQDLIRQMQTKNLYPRLVGNVGGKNINYTITKLETTIGRENDNDLVLPVMNVSAHHAKIIFNGENFEIYDCNSKNGVILNGYSTQQASLKHTDMFGLGEVILTFYL